MVFPPSGMIFPEPPSSHGPALHTNQLRTFFIPADRFTQILNGTFGMTNGVPRWRLANAQNTELATGWEMPPGFVPDPAVSLEVIAILLARPSGVVAGGNAQFGGGTTSIVTYGNGDTIPGYVAPPTSAFAIGAEVGSITVIEVSWLGAGPVAVLSTDRFASIKFRRDAAVAGDTFEDLLDFLGLVIQVLLDE